ncbi:MAG: LapA family protein [Pseudooceanicola sp.]
MRYIRYAFLAVLAAALISVALANRDLVTLTLLPAGLARIVGVNTSIQLPMFVVIFSGIIAGVFIGFFWEWLREHKHRAEARRSTKEAGKLEREVRRLKGEKHKGKDEVLALLE